MNWTLLTLTVLLCLTEIFAMKDMMRKSIVFDKNTPDVFYCPIHKPSGFEKLIVKARPLKKLCEYEGKPLPEDYKSDCYQDVDESDYACKEKYRIMMRMHPPGTEEPLVNNESTTRLARFINVDKEYYVMKMNQSKQSPSPKPNNKKSRAVRKVIKRVFLNNRLQRN